MKRALALAALLVASVASAQSFGFAQDRDESQDVSVLKKWTGDQTQIQEALYQRVTDADAWKKLWEKHAGKGQKAPAVDFDKHMVVASFLGKVDWESIAIHAVKLTKTEMVFGLEVERADCCDFSAHPLYCMAVVPKSDLKLSIIMRVRSGADVDPRKDEVLKEFAEIK